LGHHCCLAGLFRNLVFHNTAATILILKVAARVA
jgi:hypothetical protein